MKRCPVCQSVFEDRVDFCFHDGTPLEIAEADAVADPTSVPTPGAGAQAVSESGDGAGSVTKPMSRRSMFARPSVSDMLAVPEPGAPPAVAETRVPTPSTEAGGEEISADVSTPVAVEPVELPTQTDTTAPPIDVPVPDIASISDEETAPHDIAPPRAAIDLPGDETQPMDIKPAVIDVPEPAGGGLDDSWFGEDTDLFDAPDPGHAESIIEDPGFADVGDGFGGEVGFEEEPFYTQDTEQGGGPPWKIIGAVVGIAAVALVGVMSIGGGDELAKAPPPQQITEPVDVEPVAEPETEAVPADTGGAVVAEADDTGDGTVVADADTDGEADEDGVALAAPVDPPPVAAKPPASRPKASASKPTKSKPAPAPAEPPPSVWTGATPSFEEPAAESNPWGAPAETVSRGRLTITTEPAGAMVFVDSRRVGKSPTRTEVTYGVHEVKAELTDHKTSTKTINVQVAEVSVPFRMESSVMAGNCNLLGEPGAAVTMDGSGVGSLPVTVSCTPGSHKFKVSPGSGASFTVSKNVSFSQPGETVVVFLNAS